MRPDVTPTNEASARDLSRPRKLQALGILSGFTAGAWLGAAEAPTKLVSVVAASLKKTQIMVTGSFL
jgi:hypothetical protein